MLMWSWKHNQITRSIQNWISTRPKLRGEKTLKKSAKLLTFWYHAIQRISHAQYLHCTVPLNWNKLPIIVFEPKSNTNSSVNRITFSLNISQIFGGDLLFYSVCLIEKIDDQSDAYATIITSICVHCPTNAQTNIYGKWIWNSNRIQCTPSFCRE